MINMFNHYENLYQDKDKDKEDYKKKENDENDEKKENDEEEYEEINKINEINNYFKLPIYYNNNKISLKQNIINDLELEKTVDDLGNSIYSYYFNNDNDLSTKIVSQVCEYYTTDTVFLKDNQELLKKYKKNTNKYTEISPNYKNMIDLWNELKNETGFKEKYYYIDWKIFEFLNNSEEFLLIMSIYNLSSPLISLLIPIFILIVPFIILKMKDIDISFNEYITVLKVVISNNAIGQLFTNFNNVSIQEKIYLIISAGFYIFSIYQNVLVCLRFNNNMIKIHNDLKQVEIYLNYTTENMSNYLKYSSSLKSHEIFNNIVKEKLDILIEFKKKLSKITEYKLLNFKKLFEIGKIFKYFYELYDNKVYNDAFMYSFGFNGYIDCIEGLMQNIEERKVNFSKFTNKSKKNIFKNNYYACLKNENPKKNTIKFDNNMIITGPNASGKTTILKSTLINIILTQQFGCGFYDSAKLAPYKYIHCYLNIPDTSGRDSLFQAEARRCKEILDTIDSNKKDKHFCVFDELYSGTNPDEAVISAKAFLEYLIKNKNVSCFLTTHFIDLCNKLNSHNNITNYHMETNKKDNKIFYKYSLKKGISEVKGGINVLCDMNYPSEIINNTIAYQNK